MISRSEVVAGVWAKTRRDGSSPFHPLQAHLLDVGAMAEALWQQVLSTESRKRTARGLEVDEDDAGRWVALLAAAHDLGKATPGFQGRAPERIPDLRRRGLDVGEATSVPAHGLLSTLLLADLLEEPMRSALVRPVKSVDARRLSGESAVSAAGPTTRVRGTVTRRIHRSARHRRRVRLGWRFALRRLQGLEAGCGLASRLLVETAGGALVGFDGLLSGAFLQGLQVERGGVSRPFRGPPFIEASPSAGRWRPFSNRGPSGGRPSLRRGDGRGAPERCHIAALPGAALH